MDLSIFKSYDIRGVFPSELSEADAFLIAQAFAKHSNAKNVVVARDSRLSGEKLFLSFVEGLKSQGVNVCDIGQVTTECLYFAVANYNFDSGVMVTASHNPKEYNGFKMMVKNGDRINIVRGKELLSVIEKESFVNSKTIGLFSKKDIVEDYLNYIFKVVDTSKIKPLNIVVDCSNGVAGNIFSKLGDRLKNQIFLLNYQPDGNFPNHSPNPLEDGSSDQIKEEIIKQKASFGFIFDGDADRIFLADENGQLVKADITLLLLAKYFLSRNPNTGIAYNLICTKAVSKYVTEHGGRAIRTQVGFVNVMEGVLKNDGLMGGELSGHYCFKDFFYLDSGMIAFLILLQVISEDGRKLSDIIKGLTIFAKAEANFTVKDKKLILDKIQQKYNDAKQDFLDGITVEYSDWWFNVRASNTEPLLRLTIEANNPELLEQKKKELSDLIQN